MTLRLISRARGGSDVSAEPLALFEFKRSDSRRQFIRGGALGLAGGFLAAGAEQAQAQSPAPHETATTDVHGIADTAQIALLDRANDFVDPAGLKLEPSGNRGTFHVGIDGAETDTTGLRLPHSGGVPGIRSFMGTTNPEAYEFIRLAHPRDPKGNSPGHNPGGPVDLFIGPYNSGMGIEFKGVLECWVEEWSIHNNNRRGGKGTAAEARLWIGNNIDTGGLLLSSHAEGVGDDPRKRWTRLISRNFQGTQGNGAMQFIVRDPLDHFSFGFGDTGSDVGEVGDPVETLRIKSNGYIGTGTTRPLARLHLADFRGVAARWEDTSSMGGTSALRQRGAEFSINTYDSSGTFTGTPLVVDGTTGAVQVSDDLIVKASGSGVIVRSPDGQIQRRLGIDNAGNIEVTPL